jgi:D-arabinose 1-dehydrogenase-like Zn-dependent alcohol dehydrogenase
MRAMQIIEWGKPLEAREYPDPEPKGEEVLLRVEAAGVCHSDVHIWDGYFDLGGERRISLESRGVHLPFTMGHEIAGEVAALGPQASGVKVGDKVVAYPWIGCGECAVCRKGEELLCLNPRTLGTRRAGGYGTHVIVPHGRYLLPHEGVPQGLAATYTCSGITAFSAHHMRAGAVRRAPARSRASARCGSCPLKGEAISGWRHAGLRIRRR